MKSFFIGLIVAGSLAAALVFIIVMACSAYHVRPNTVGLFVNSWDQILPETVHEPGLYVISPLNRLISFPTDLIVHSFHGEEYNINTRTQDGLELALTVEAYVQIDPTHVRDVYLRYGPDYDDFVRGAIKSEVRNVGGQFKAGDYQTRFTEISDTITARLKEVLPTMYFNLHEICITSYDLPDEYEDMLLQIAGATQDLNIAETRMKAEQTALNVEEEKAKQDVDIDVMYQEGMLDNTLIEEISKLDARKYNKAIEANTVTLSFDSSSTTDDSDPNASEYKKFNSFEVYQKFILYNDIYNNNVSVQDADNVIVQPK